jgi:hypothetical protein
MSQKLTAALLCTLGAFGLGACTDAYGNPDNRSTSAIIGGAGGAMIGQAIGGDTESTLIGTAAGAGLGALAGQDQDAQQRAIQQRRVVTQPVYRAY